MNKATAKLLALICAISMAMSMLCGGLTSAIALADDATFPRIEVEYKTKDTNTEYDAAQCTAITLSGTGAQSTGSGVSIEGGTITISAAGDYRISGELTEGCIVINAADTDDVRLIFNGASITCSNGPAINCQSADKLIITLAKDTENALADGAEYAVQTDDEPNAAVYSKADISINGDGALSVTGNYLHGILSKDKLKICGGTINVTAAGDALRGHDGVAIAGGTLTLDAQDDGIQSNKTDDVEKGWVVIGGGNITINAVNDGIQAETVVQIDGGELTIVTGGGSENSSKTHQEQFGMMGGKGMRPNNTRADGTSGATQANASGNSSADSQDNSGDAATNTSGNEAAAPSSTAGATSDATSSASTTSGKAKTSAGSGDYAKTGTSSDQTSSATTDNRHRDMPQGMTPPDGATPPEMPDGATMPDGMTPPDWDSDTGSISVGDTANSDYSTDDETVASAKGIKCAGTVYINGGVMDINSADDALHSNTEILVNGGEISIQTGDDAMHADSILTINGGIIDASKSYEGLEAVTITLNGGEVNIVASDDGVNAAGGVDSSTDSGNWGRDQFAAGDQAVYINDGKLTIDASGDGLDSNGNVYMTGGTVLVSGPTNSGNGALDYAGEFEQSGGVLIAAGAVGMMQSISETSTQPAISVVYTETQAAGARITLVDEYGNVIVSYAPEKEYGCAVISAPTITQGSTYKLYTGGDAAEMFATSGALTGGTELCSISVGSELTSVSSDGSTYAGGFGFGGMRGGK